MIPSTCPCCEVLQPPHKGDCTFHADAPGDAATFDEVSALRAEIARLREERLQREALWTACADKTQLVYGGAFRPMPLTPGPEGDG